MIQQSREGGNGYGFAVNLDLPIGEATEQVTAALKSEGFGVLTTIDVQQTLKTKLDVDVPPYVILGACNPALAHRALQAEPDLGLLLPCNVIVHRDGDHSRVAVVDPVRMLAIVGENPALAAVAEEVATRLRCVIDRLDPSRLPGPQPGSGAAADR